MVTYAKAQLLTQPPWAHCTPLIIQGINRCTISIMSNCMTKCTKKVQCIVEYAAT